MTLGLSPQPYQRQPILTIPQDRPVYRIKEGKFFGPDDCLYEEGAVIEFHDEPNTEMEPLNALAEEAMKKYLAKLDTYGKAVAEKAGKHYASLADAFENSRALMTEETRRIRPITGKEQVPLMGAKKKAGKIAKLDADGSVPLMGAIKNPVQSNSAEKNAGKNEVNKANEVKNTDI